MGINYQPQLVSLPDFWTINSISGQMELCQRVADEGKWDFPLFQGNPGWKIWIWPDIWWFKSVVLMFDGVDGFGCWDL